MTGEGNPPRHEMIVTEGDELGQLCVEGAIAFQRVAAHFCNGPVAFFKIVFHTTLSATRNRIFDQRMIGNDRETVVFAVHTPNKAAQERLNQFFRFGALFLFFRMDHSDNAIAVHHFFHLRRRNKVAFLRIDLEETETFFRAFDNPFRTRRLGVKLLF